MARGAGLILTDERKRLIADMIARGESEGILKAVNRLPGPPISTTYLRDYLAVQRSMIHPPSSVASAWLANFETVKEFADRNGVRFRDWEDLPRVNEAAKAAHHPGFIRELPCHRFARAQRRRKMGG